MKEAALDGTEAGPAPVAATDAAPGSATRRPRRGTDWWAEARGILWLILIVLGFHSFVAKPFYIPSESMLPGLRIGDRLVVSKFAYGWSFVSPTIPDPAAIFNSVVLRGHEDSWSVALPRMRGRMLGSLPERGDVVIVTHPVSRSDYIKRVIGLPGDRLDVRGGIVFLNGVAVKRGPLHYASIPIDTNSPCDRNEYPGAQVAGPDGRMTCRLPLYTETLPNGRSYDTVDLEPNSAGDDYPAVVVPAGHVFLMGDNRDRSADSRFALAQQGLGGPVPVEYLGGRAEFVTFSLDGDATLNPLTWWGSFRSGRAGHSLHPVRTK